jgi:ectoine hydroxylase
MQLSDTQLGEFERDGYLFIPDLIDEDDVCELRAEIPRIVALEREEVMRAETGELFAAFALDRYSEPFARLLRHPRLLGPAHQILGGPVYAHQYKIIAKDPFGSLRFPWHQDAASWHAYDGMPEPLAMNFALYLDQVTEFNGPITFMPGSHAGGMAEGEDSPYPAGRSPLHTLKPETVQRMVGECGMVAPKGPAGCGVFFHGCLAHASPSNLSPQTRYIVYLTYNPVDNYIRRPTRPDYYANQDFTPIEPLVE